MASSTYTHLQCTLQLQWLYYYVIYIVASCVEFRIIVSHFTKSKTANSYHLFNILMTPSPVSSDSITHGSSCSACCRHNGLLDFLKCPVDPWGLCGMINWTFGMHFPQEIYKFHLCSFFRSLVKCHLIRSICIDYASKISLSILLSLQMALYFFMKDVSSLN